MISIVYTAGWSLRIHLFEHLNILLEPRKFRYKIEKHLISIKENPRAGGINDIVFVKSRQNTCISSYFLWRNIINATPALKREEATRPTTFIFRLACARRAASTAANRVKNSSAPFPRGKSHSGIGFSKKSHRGFLLKKQKRNNQFRYPKKRKKEKPNPSPRVKTYFSKKILTTHPPPSTSKTASHSPSTSPPACYNASDTTPSPRLQNPRQKISTTPNRGCVVSKTN